MTPFLAAYLIAACLIASTSSSKFNYSSCPGPVCDSVNICMFLFLIAVEHNITLIFFVVLFFFCNCIIVIGQHELQTSNVSSSFDGNLFAGTYFEILYHDITQYPTCLKPSCVTSIKQWKNSTNTNYGQEIDHWSMNCFGEYYGNIIFVYNQTDIKGCFIGHVVHGNQLQGHEFENIVVATGPVCQACGVAGTYDSYSYSYDYNQSINFDDRYNYNYNYENVDSRTQYECMGN